MAGLISDNISIASARQYGFAKERNICTFCGKRSTPSASDPKAPVFAFFSLVDCRHYVCQPCALVNCDNAGRYIRCPTCNALSRLAQTGKLRFGHDETRIAIDDGVSSVMTHTTRRSTRLPLDHRPPKSAMAKGDRSKKRATSVQFHPDTSLVEGETTSPLTRDAVGQLPEDPIYTQRSREEREKERERPNETSVEVNLYTIRGKAASPRRSKASERSRSVPMPPRERKLLPPPVPFAQPPPLRIHTIDEDESEAGGINNEAQEAQNHAETIDMVEARKADALRKKKEEEEEEEEKFNAATEQERMRASVLAEIAKSLEAALEKESQERSTIAEVEQYRRNSITKQREAQERDQLAARGQLAREFDFRLSPRTPHDFSEGQVSATSDEDTPAPSVPRQPRRRRREEVHSSSTTSRTPIVSSTASTATDRITESSFPQLVLALAETESVRRQNLFNLEEVERRVLNGQLEHDTAAVTAENISHRAANLALELQQVMATAFAELEDAEARRRAFLEEQQSANFVRLVLDMNSIRGTLAEDAMRRAEEKRQNASVEATAALLTEEMLQRTHITQYAREATAQLHLHIHEVLTESSRHAAAAIQRENDMAMQRLREVIEQENTARWKLLEETQNTYRDMWMQFSVSMPYRTLTIDPVPSQSFAPKSSTSSSTVNTLYAAPVAASLSSATEASVLPVPLRHVASLVLSQRQLAEVVEEEELRRLEVRQNERLAWHDIATAAAANRRWAIARKLQRQDDMDTEDEAAIRAQTFANAMRRLMLREEEQRLELQQRHTTVMRRISSRAADEHAQAVELERMLRGIADRSRGLLQRCHEDALVSVSQAEAEGRRIIFFQEERDWARLSDRIFSEWSLLPPLAAMDAAVRQFTAEVHLIARNENIERLALIQAEQRARATLNQRHEEAEALALERNAAVVSECTTRMRDCQREESHRRSFITDDEAQHRQVLSRDALEEGLSLATTQNRLLRRALEDLTQEEDDARHDIIANERETRRPLRRNLVMAEASAFAAQPLFASSADRTSLTDVVGRSPSSEVPCSATAEEEELRRLMRRREMAREEELLEAHDRLREAEQRIAAEVNRRQEMEFASQAAKLESEHLLREAEHRAEDRIRAARSEAEQRAEEAIGRMRDEAERGMAKRVAQEAMAAEEQRALLVARLSAAERALSDAESRAEEARRATSAVQRQVEHMATQQDAERASLMDQLRRAQQEAPNAAALTMAATERLHTMELETRAAMAECTAEAKRATNEAQRQMEEMAAQQVAREAELRTARRSFRQAKQHMREFEDSIAHGGTDTEQQENLGQKKRDVEPPKSSPKASHAEPVLPLGVAQQVYNVTTGSITAAFCSDIIRTAIREAVDEIVRATRAARRLTDDAAKRAAVEAQRMRRRQAERDLAEQQLLDVENESVEWPVESTIRSTSWSVGSPTPKQRSFQGARPAEMNRRDNPIAVEEDTAQRREFGTWRREEDVREMARKNKREPIQSTVVDTRLMAEMTKEKVEEESVTEENRRAAAIQTAAAAAAADAADPVCQRCFRRDTKPCTTCGTQVCVYCGSIAPHRTCCEGRHAQLVRDFHRRRPRNTEASMRTTMDPIAPLAQRVERKLLPDQESEPRAPEPLHNIAAQTDASLRSPDTSRGSLPEPKTVRKHYEAFFVPLHSDAEPRRPKPPTPTNYMPGMARAARPASTRPQTFRQSPQPRFPAHTKPQTRPPPRCFSPRAMGPVRPTPTATRVPLVAPTPRASSARRGVWAESRPRRRLSARRVFEDPLAPRWDADDAVVHHRGVSDPTEDDRPLLARTFYDGRPVRARHSPTRCTPTLHELDKRLRHLQHHRVWGPEPRQTSPSRVCAACDGDVGCGWVSPRGMRPAHDPCITVRLHPRPSQRTRGNASAARRGSSRGATPRLVSPPWRTEFNSGPLRPPWSVEQPHAFVVKSKNRRLLTAQF